MNHFRLPERIGFDHAVKSIKKLTTDSVEQQKFKQAVSKSKSSEKTSSVFSKAKQAFKTQLKAVQHDSAFDRIPAKGSTKHNCTLGNNNDKLKSFDLMSNIPADRIKFSDDQRKILQNMLSEKQVSGNKENDEFKALLTLTKQANNNKSIPYTKLSPLEKKVFDQVKFQQIQTHLEQLRAPVHSQGLNQRNDSYTELGINHNEANVGEVLSKTLAYLDSEILDGKTLKLPVDDGNGSLKLVDFTIKHQTMGNNLSYYTLKPQEGSKASPWVVIRGTDPNVLGNATAKGGLESIMADAIKKEGIANDPIDNDFSAILNSIQNLSVESDGKPVNFAGHSLGGEYVQHMATKICSEENAIIPVGKVYAYNSPGVPKDTNELYQSMIKNNTQPNIINFDKTGDAVPGAGRHLIGRHLRVKQNDGVLDPMLNHRKVDLNHDHELQEVDTHAEEAKGMRILSEQVRISVGGNAVRTAVKVGRCMGYFQNLPEWSKPYL